MMSSRRPRVQVATTREGVTVGDPVTGRRGRRRVRQVINALTLATPLGLLLAHVGGATLRPGPHGTLVAAGYRSRFPAPYASAVTNGRQTSIWATLESSIFAFSALSFSH